MKILLNYRYRKLQIEFDKLASILEKLTLNRKEEQFANAISSIYYCKTESIFYKEEIRRSLYYKKLKFYSKQLQKEREVFSSDVAKLDLLSNLLGAANYLSEFDDNEITALFESLEKQFYTYYPSEENKFLGHCESINGPDDSGIKYVKVLLSNLKKKIFRRKYIDLRFYFQCIFRFLFKNMDDESGERNVLFSFQENSNAFPQLKNLDYVRFKNYSETKRPGSRTSSRAICCY